MIDRDSDTWLAVSAFIEVHIDRALTELASPALDYPNTQRVRGQLLALRAVLALAQTPSAPQPTSFPTIAEGLY